MQNKKESFHRNNKPPFFGIVARFTKGNKYSNTDKSFCACSK
jgi:hypothetical protein